MRLAGDKAVDEHTRIGNERSLYQMPECPVKIEFLKDIQTAMGGAYGDP